MPLHFEVQHKARPRKLLLAVCPLEGPEGGEGEGGEGEGGEGEGKGRGGKGKGMGKGREGGGGEGGGETGGKGGGKGVGDQVQKNHSLTANAARKTRNNRLFKL